MLSLRYYRPYLDLAKLNGVFNAAVLLIGASLE